MHGICERYAGVAQWQSRSFPCLRRGFDSLHPLQTFRVIQLIVNHDKKVALFGCVGSVWDILFVGTLFSPCFGPVGVVLQSCFIPLARMAPVRDRLPNLRRDTFKRDIRSSDFSYSLVRFIVFSGNQVDVAATRDRIPARHHLAGFIDATFWGECLKRELPKKLGR